MIEKSRQGFFYREVAYTKNICRAKVHDRPNFHFWSHEKYLTICLYDCIVFETVLMTSESFSQFFPREKQHRYVTNTQTGENVLRTRTRTTMDVHAGKVVPPPPIPPRSIQESSPVLEGHHSNRNIPSLPNRILLYWLFHARHWTQDGKLLWFRSGSCWADDVLRCWFLPLCPTSVSTETLVNEKCFFLL